MRATIVTLGALALSLSLGCDKTEEATPTDSGPIVRDVGFADTPSATDVQTPTDTPPATDVQTPTDAPAVDAGPGDVPAADVPATDAPATEHLQPVNVLAVRTKSKRTGGEVVSEQSSVVSKQSEGHDCLLWLTTEN